MAEIAAEKVRLLDVLENDGLLVVPRYQRSFSWEIENVSELWEDIRTIIEDENREHFAGAIILCDSNESKLAMEIVDGQQRLITLTILLRAMYDNLNSNTGLANDIYDHIERGRYEEKRYFRLTLGEQDVDFFKAFVQLRDRPLQKRRGKLKSHKRLVNAYNFFDEKIKSLTKSGRKGKEAALEELFKKLKQKLIAVRIKVSSEVDAYAVFETINSKKADLTVSDLLKNYIFSQAHKSDENSLEQARQNWNQMIEDLGQDIETSQYIRHYWISVHEPSRDKDLYRKIKEFFRDNPTKLKLFAKDLATEAAAYSAIIQPEEGDSGQASFELLTDVNNLRIRQAYPLLLAAVASKVPSKSFKQLLETIVSVSLRRGLIDKNPNELEATYATSAKLVRDNGAKAISGIVDEISGYSPKNKEIINYLEDNAVSENLAKFVLVKLEKSKSTGEKLVYRPTLEHVLPQNPDKLSSWKMTEVDHKVYAYKFGNLTLVGKKFNSVMSNRAYLDKRSELAKSDIFIASELAEENKKWGKEEIDARTTILLKFVTEKWAI